MRISLEYSGPSTFYLRQRATQSADERPLTLGRHGKAWLVTMVAVIVPAAWRGRRRAAYNCMARVDLALVPGRLAARVVRVDIMDSDATFTTDGNTRALRSDHVPLVLLLEITRLRDTAVPWYPCASSCMIHPCLMSPCM